MTDKKIRTMTKINSQLQNSADLLYIEKLAEDTWNIVLWGILQEVSFRVSLKRFCFKNKKRKKIYISLQ